MARKNRKHPTPRIAPEDVASGKISLHIEDLILLIGRVNPTDRGLDPAETARRYALKSALQSLLIRQHGGSLEVEVGPTDKGVILIRHRQSGRDAAHAKLDSLDEDARAWVRGRLAEAETEQGLEIGAVRPPLATTPQPVVPQREPHPPEQAEPTGTLHDLLRQAQAALEAWDYDLVQRCLEAALRQHPGEPAAARELLAFLVDELAADESALRWEARLRGSALADPTVRRCLALAAARQGQPERARRLVIGLDSDPAAPIWREIAHANLRLNDRAAAEEALARLEVANPFDTELPSLRQQAAALRASERAPEEAALEALAASGNWSELEPQAEALLRRWPASVCGRRLLARARDERRRAALLEKRALVLSLLATGDLDLAEQMLRELRGVLEVDDLERALDNTRAETRARTAAHLIAALQRDPTDPDALRALQKSDASMRAAVRQALPLPHLDWLEVMTVEAVVSLTQAAVALEQGRAEQALGSLEALDPASLALSPAQGLARQARELVRRQRHDRWLVLERELQRAWDRQDSERTSCLLEKAKALDLATADRQALQDWQARFAERARQAQWAAEVRRAAQDGHWLRVKKLLDEPGATPWPADLEALRSALPHHIREQWRCGEILQPGKQHDLQHTLRSTLLDSVIICVPPGGTHAYLPTLTGHWGVVWEIDLATETLARALVFRCPQPLESMGFSVQEGLITIYGSHGEVVSIDIEHGQVQRYSSAAPWAGIGGRIELIIPLAAETCCVSTFDQTKPYQIMFVDTRTNRILRQVAEYFSPTLLPGAARPTITASDGDGCLAFFDERGRVVRPGRLDGFLHSSTAVALQDGSLVLLRERTDILESEADGPTELDLAFVEAELVRLDSRGRQLASLPLDGIDLEASHCLAVCGATPLTWFIGMRPGKNRPTMMLAHEHMADGSIRLLWSLEMGPDVRLVQNVTGSQVYACLPTADGLAWSRLGRQPPTLPAAAARQLLQRKPFTLLFCGNRPEREDEALAGTTPPDPRLALDMADRYAERRDWEQVARLLEPWQDTDVPQGILQHFLHLLGIALLFRGDKDAAKACWQRAAQQEEGSCNLEICFQALQAIEATDTTPTAPIGGFVSAGLPPLVAAIRAADSASTPREAVAILEPAHLYAEDERQILARLALAWLDQEPASPAEWLSKMLVLSDFHHTVHLEGLPFSWDLPVPGHTWSLQRMREIAERAGHWLDQAQPPA